MFLKIVHFCYFKNTFPFVLMSSHTDDIGKKHPKNLVEQGIAHFNVCQYNILLHYNVITVIYFVIVWFRNIVVIIICIIIAIMYLACTVFISHVTCGCDDSFIIIEYRLYPVPRKIFDVFWE